MKSLYEEINVELILSVISLVLSISIGIYNLKLNKKIYGPKIRVVFERVFEHDEYGNFIEGRYSRYNILITNESIYNIYDFSCYYEFYNGTSLVNYNLRYVPGIFKEKIPCFVPSQKYSSYFDNFKELKNTGINRIRFYFEYKMSETTTKYQKEIFDVNVITLSDICIIRTKVNN